MATIVSMRATMERTASGVRKSVAAKTLTNVAEMTDFVTACPATWGHSVRKVRRREERVLLT